MMSTYAKCCRACVLLYVYISLPLYSYVCVYVCVCERYREIERKCVPQATALFGDILLL